MENHSAPIASHFRGSAVRFWPWLLVLLVLLFVGFIRVRLLDMPLERDEGEYAYAGQLILQGIPPYELAYNMKLPGTYYAYALGMAVFGQTVAGVHLTLLAANSLTIVFVFLLGRKLFGLTAGWVACASYGVMSASPTVAGLAAHATHFVVLFAVPATGLLWQAAESKRRRTFFFSGLLYGLAFLMKQQGICFGLFGSLFLLWLAVRNKSIFTRDFARTGLVFGLGMILPFGLTCFYLALAGVFYKFWFWTFTYAWSYVTSVPLGAGIQSLESCLRYNLDQLLGVWIILILGLPPAFFNRGIRRQICFAIFFGTFSFLGTAAGLYFRPHYFILILPALVLAMGAGIASLQKVLRFGVIEDIFKSLPLILFGMAMSWFVFYQEQYFFQWPPDKIAQNLYMWNPVVESRAVAQYLREHSEKNARIAVFGSEPEIYFYAQRHSATGYIYTYALMEAQPDALRMQHEMMREIESNKPEYLVYVSHEFSWIFNPNSDRTIFRWFERYAGQFYEQAGVVDDGPDGKSEYLWGDAARNHHSFKGQYIIVYKLKPSGTPS
ncbi:MAG: glycosyltransferase family 39 protein [Verrucomicrobiia bacterium]